MDRSGRSVRVAIALVLAGTMLPVGAHPASAATDGRASQGAAAVSQSAPKPPATGHLHLLAAPVRIASSVTGLRLPKRRLAAYATPLLHVAGAGGLPSSGIRAVAIVVTTSSPAGATSIRIGSSSVTPVLVTSSGTTSAFTIAPVSSGSIQLRNGAHATNLTVDVVGWFSATTETGTAGLFRTLAGRRVVAATVAAGATRTVSILGAQDVPGSGASAVMLRVRTASTGSGALAVGPSATRVSGYVSEAYRSGTTSDLVTVRIGPAGSIAIRNTGTRSATVSLEAVGWFTDGKDASAYGDGLSLATPFKALSAVRVGTVGISRTVCGRSGVPAELSSRPPSLVLARGLATSASAATTLLADAVGATPSGAAALIIRTATSLAGQLLLAPGSTCGTRFAMTTGAVTLTVEPYAWFAGGVIMSDHARVLTGSALAAITSVTDTTVTFTGASLPNLVVGDVIGAGISAMTPAGLMRTVTATSPGANTLVLTTEDALLGDAVLQGSLSAGRSATAPAVTAPTPARARVSALPAGTSCDATGSLMSMGVTVSCGTTFGDGSIWSANVNASAGIAMTVGADIPWGLLPSVHVQTALGVSAATSATVTATAGHDINETFDMPTRYLAPVDYQIGPWPVVIVPELSAALHVTGTLQATLQATAGMHAGASVSFDSDTGFTPTHSFGGDGSGSYNASLDANLKITFEPTVKALLYRIHTSYVSASLSPYVEVKANSCTIIGHAGVDLTFGFSLGITKAVSVSRDFTLPLLDSTIFTIPWRNCAVWSGTLTYRANGHYFDDQGRPVDDVNRSTEVTLTAPPDGVPPPDASYHATGSGSGAYIVYNYVCDHLDAPPTPAVDTYNWGGDVKGAETGSFSFGPSVTTGFTVLGEIWGGTIDGTVVSTGCDGNSTTTARSWDDGFFLIPDLNGPPPTNQDGGGDWMAFATPPGQSDFSGTRLIDTPQANGGTYHEELSYALHKTCLQGGTDC